VLVPRPETEELATLALERAPQGGSIVDLGTGSGALAIALAVERPDLRLVAVDVSHNALELAKANAARHGVAERIVFELGSWWEPLGGSEFDLVVSNPPYVDPQAPAGLAPDVRAHEPPLALFTAPGDPASCYRAIAAGLPAHLRPGGWLVAETGVGASGPALAWLQQQPFLQAVELRPDFAGIDRYLLAQRRG
jgi:release factor glutamine methyltransferase